MTTAFGLLTLFEHVANRELKCQTRKGRQRRPKFNPSDIIIKI